MNIDLLSNLVITKVNSAFSMYTPKDTKIKRKDRPCWAVVIKYEGETVYTAVGKQFVSDINHIILLPKGCSYDWECKKAGHYSTVEFESDATYFEPISFYVKNGEKILKMFKDLEYNRNLKKPLSEFESIRDTYSIILSAVRYSSDGYYPSKKQRIIADAVDYISSHYNENITNDSLALLSGVSNVYFRKLFSEIMGASPIAYVHELRIEKAKEMLKSDYGTLSDLAKAIGYSSIYDFSRAFKKHTGTSPTKYVKG